MVKQIVHPETGKVVKLGRRTPIVHFPQLACKNYLLKQFPAAPVSTDYTAPNQITTSFLHEILGNDSLGDCTSAAAFHIAATFLGNVGSAISFTVNDVIKFYSAVSGYVPGNDSTDQGADVQTVLAYWQNHGLIPNQNKITAWVAIDATNKEEIKSAIWLFENIYFGVGLPNLWLDPFPSRNGFTWDVSGDSNPDNGHAFCGLGYNDQGVKIDTWGMLGTITWAAISKYAARATGGELYAVLSQDAISKITKKNPIGFDLSQLKADIDSFAAA